MVYSNSTDDGRPALTLPRDPWSGTAYVGWAPFPADVYNAIGGNKMLVENGQPVDPSTWDPIGGALGLAPRTSARTIRRWEGADHCCH